jgi:hypothetical protein
MRHDWRRSSRIANRARKHVERARLVLASAGGDPVHREAVLVKTASISLRSVQRIWEAHNLQPHRVRSFKRSGDPEFVAKMTDIVGLYLDPPAHAVVLSIDEKSQIQALDRTQPGLPLKPGRCGTMTHDDKRHGTTTLFAALDVLDGKVIGRCMQQHRNEEFIRFLNDVERAVPPGKLGASDRSRRTRRHEPDDTLALGAKRRSPASGDDRREFGRHRERRAAAEHGEDPHLPHGDAATVSSTSPHRSRCRATDSEASISRVA